MVLNKILYLVLIGSLISNCQSFGNLETLINNTENQFGRITNSIYKCVDFEPELKIVKNSFGGMYNRVTHHVSMDISIIKNVASHVVVDIKDESRDTLIEALSVTTKIITEGNDVANRTFEIIGHPFSNIIHSVVTLLDLGGFPIVATVQIVDLLDSIDNRLHEINDILIGGLNKIEMAISNILHIACAEPDKQARR